MNPARIVFVTGHSFGIAALRGLISSSAYSEGAIQVVNVLGLHPRHALSTVGYADLTPFARQFDLPLVIFDSIKSEDIEKHLSLIQHDYLFVIGLSQLVPSSILSMPAKCNGSQQRNTPSHGCIGMHPTLLPHGRGRAPIPWTIINALQISGVTAFFLEDEADSGGIINSESYPISLNETATSLFSKAEQAHFTICSRIAHLCAIRQLESIPQDENNVSIWARRRPDDGWINFACPALELATLVRSLTDPYPRAFFAHNNTVLKVGKASVIPHANTEPVGKVLSVEQGSLIVKTRTDAIHLSGLSCIGEWQLPEVGTILFSSEMEGKIGK